MSRNENSAQTSISMNRWLRNFLWAQASQVIQSYGSSLFAYGLSFLGAHFKMGFQVNTFIQQDGYCQEIIDFTVWAHNTIKVAPGRPIVQGCTIGVTHLSHSSLPVFQQSNEFKHSLKEIATFFGD